MKNIFKTSKRGIAAILTLCILLGIAGTHMNVTAMAAETTATVEETAVATEEITTVVVEESTTSTEDTTVVTEENTQELVPRMARECGYGNLTSWYNIAHKTKSLILSDVSGNYSAVVGKNPDIYYGSNGLIYLCGTGNYSGKTYPTDLQRSGYL